MRSVRTWGKREVDNEILPQELTAELQAVVLPLESALIMQHYAARR
ncbi:MAG: hypothetical protein IH878_00230 [Gemmatimonadetes bacterium]|nr:hypothetical protein [Gemmatimonadota bacterium]